VVRTVRCLFALGLALAASCGSVAPEIGTPGLAAGRGGPGSDVNVAAGPMVAWPQGSDTSQFEQRMRAAFGDRLVSVWMSEGRVLNVGVVHPSRCEREVVAQLASVYGAVGTVVPQRPAVANLPPFRTTFEHLLLDASG
jgi:hypothetical protein